MSVISSVIDLRKFSPQIFDQGYENSCVANAVTAAIRLQSVEYHRDVGELAREQVYYDARLPLHKMKDIGSGFTFMLDAAQQTGIASQDVALRYESYSDGVQSMFIDQRATNPAVQADASAQKVFGYTNYSNYTRYIDGKLENGVASAAVQEKQINEIIQTQLMHGKAVLVASNFPTWFYNAPAKLGDPPNTSDPSGDSKAHAVMIVGMNNTLHGGSYIVQNSYGTGYGDNGYATIPYHFKAAGLDFNEIAVVNGFQGVDLTWTAATEQVAMLYSSLYDRAPDHAGMAYWSHAITDNVKLKQLANDFYNTQEGDQTYGDMSNGDFVNAIYLNTMGEAADPAGRAYWAGLIANGTFSRGDFVANLISTVADTQGGAGSPSELQHDFLINRATVGQNFAITYQQEGGAEAYRCLDGVTSDADTVQAALVGIQSHMSAAAFA